MAKFGSWGANLVLAIAGGALFCATPAAAQFRSKSFEFLDDVKKKDMDAVQQKLSVTGPTLVNTQDSTSGDSALHIVVARSDVPWLNYLIAHGADVNARNAKGVSPLRLAVTGGFTDGVTILLAHGAKVDDADAQGETPLISAVHQRNLDMVRALLAAGANPRRADGSGRSAQDYARLDDHATAIADAIEENLKKSAAKSTRTYGPKF